MQAALPPGLKRADRTPADLPDVVEIWFAEYGGFIVEVSDDAAFTRLAAELGTETANIGETIAAAELVLTAPDETISLADLREAWAAPLRDFYGSAA